MLTIFFKSLLVYVVLCIAMRILGKRQLGELEVSELVTTILISEIASIPISNPEMPLYQSMIPLFLIISFEVICSFLLSRYTKLKNIISPSPSTLIYKGRINQKELRKNRISPEELLSELRLKNIPDPSHVEYAILEQNGMLSVIPKIAHQQVTLNDLKIDATDSGITHIIISQGVWDEHNLKILNKSKSYFEKYLQKNNLSYKDVFLLTIDDTDSKSLIIKENSK